MLTQIAAGRVFDYSHAVGRSKNSGPGFMEPAAAALGAGDVVYVLNRGNETINNVSWKRTGIGSRVTKITIGTVPGDEEYLGEFGEYGDGEGQIIWGAGIVTDRQENVYVTDEWLNRVSIFDKDGAFLEQWPTTQSSDSGPNGASGLGIDADGNLYVVDGRSHQVRKFTKGGTLLTSWGRYGSDQGEFNAPWGVTVDHQGYVYVADHKNHRVQKFSSDGQWVAQFGSPGTGRGQLHRPTGVAVDPDGDVYISDWSDNGVNPGRVHVFDPDGNFVISLIGDAQVLAKWGQEALNESLEYSKARRRVRTFEPEWRFALPHGILFDHEKARLLVVDTHRHRIQIYNKPKDYQAPQFNL